MFFFCSQKNDHAEVFGILTLLRGDESVETFSTSHNKTSTRLLFFNKIFL